jgi:taurine dioxygenase
MDIEKSDTYYGAKIYGIDFSKSINSDTISKIRNAWIQYQVLTFPNQSLTLEDLERSVLYFGNNCSDPYILPEENYKYVAKIYRNSNEKTKIFAENWHNDWFHMKEPPIGTMLYGVKIPPIGGDTLFSDLYESFNDLPDKIKNIISDKFGINSARLGYSPEGAYGSKDIDRSMNLVYNDSAYETQLHPLVTVHSESKKQVINCNLAYTIGIKDLDDDQSKKLLNFLFKFQTQEKYIYRLKWNKNDLTLWDNRCTLHRATDGYDGYERLLYRVTVK